MPIKTLYLILVSLVTCYADQAVTMNFSYELVPQPNPGDVWGQAVTFINPVKWHPPAGYRTVITGVSGDVVAWPSYNLPVPQGARGEVGWGLKTTQTDGSPDVSYPDSPGASGPFSNSPVWVQGELDWVNQAVRIPFDRKFSLVLPSDNTLLCKPFIALVTGMTSVHVEATFTVTYRYEPGTDESPEQSEMVSPEPLKSEQQYGNGLRRTKPEPGS